MAGDVDGTCSRNSPRVDRLLELGLGEEVVLAPVLLTRAPRSGRRRDRNLEIVATLEKLADQGSLAGAGRPGDDEELRPGGQCRKRLTSSSRWRSDSPATVFDWLMRHWFRNRAALTRPNFGTAISMSKTFAVPT